jgi:hypothetical protein
MIYFLLNNNFVKWSQNVQLGSGSVIDWPPVSRTMIQDYGSADPEP